MKKTFLTLTVIAILSVFCFTAVAPVVLAQALPNKAPTTTEGLKEIEKDSGLQTGTVGSFVSNIIRWILGIIGVILVAMFVYGGVMYATSAGNDERVETGKKVMIYAIIGVAIIAVAFIASEYVVKALIPETGTGSRG